MDFFHEIHRIGTLWAGRYTVGWRWFDQFRQWFRTHSGHFIDDDNHRFTALCLGLPGWAATRRNIHPPPSLSSPNLYQLLPCTMIHSILPVQTACLAIFLHNLSSCPLWSTSWSGALHLIPYSIHFFTQSVYSFRNTCPYHCSLFCCSTKIMSSVIYITHLSDHFHLWSLKCHLIFFPDRPGLAFM